MAATTQSISATPILDSGVRPKGRRRNLGGVLIGLVFGLLFGLVLVNISNRVHRVDEDAAHFLLITYFLAITLAVITHELGHLLAGWMVGFRFSSIAIGPVTLRMEYGRLKLQLRRTLPAGGYAGMHIDRVCRLHRRLLRFISGGPLANLVAAVLGAAWLSYVPPRAISLAAFIEMFWMMSAVLGFVNLVPFRVGMLYTDGARILMLRSSLPKARRWITLTAISNQSQKGVRGRLLKRTWMEAAGKVGDGSVDDFAGNWVAYAAANDRKDAAVAAVHLERCLDLVKLMGPATRDLVALEAAVFSAWFREDATTAQKWLGQVKKRKALSKLMLFRADIALRCARKDFSSALSHWQDAYGYIEKLPNTPIKTRLLEGFAEWRGDIEKRCNSHNGVAVMSPVQPA